MSSHVKTHVATDLYSIFLMRNRSMIVHMYKHIYEDTVDYLKKIYERFSLSDIRLENFMGAPAPMAPMLPTLLSLVLVICTQWPIRNKGRLTNHKRIKHVTCASRTKLLEYNYVYLLLKIVCSYTLPPLVQESG